MSRMNRFHCFSARLCAGRGLAGLGLAGALWACGGESTENQQLRALFLPGAQAQLGAAGSDSSTGGQGGTGSVAMGGSPGAAGTAVGAAGTTAGASGTGGPMDPQECNGPNLADGIFGTPAPQSGLLVDFSSYVAAGTWGDAGLGQITGGTSLYSVRPDANLTVAAEGGQLHLTASMAMTGDYTGIVLWFAPCVNASAFTGLTFPVTGDLGGARMQVKAQTSPDYPIDVTNSKGKCVYETQEEQFTVCQQPVVNIDALEENPVVLGWDEFTGGVPEPDIDPNQLLGFELQFQCQAEGGACELDVTIGTVSFTE